jgi:large subunit ribosomal protein L3
MSQAWDKTGKRLCVTRCKVGSNVVLATQPQNPNQYLIGFGTKKLKNMTKPLRTIVEKSGFSSGVTQIRGVNVTPDQSDQAETIKPGTLIKAEEVLKVGDVVSVQGTSKGRGFAGAMKRHGFHGGPATHGQSDRARAVGSIGAGTTPGKVLKGKKMPGHYGTDTKTVSGLVVLHIDTDSQEVWLSGPVPGSLTSAVKISPIGKTKSIELDADASGIVLPAPAEVTESAEATEVTESAETATETETK